MKTSWTLLPFITFCLLAVAAISVGAQTLRPSGETFAWSGELVSFDANTQMVTVKARVVGDQAIADLPHYKAGDRIVVTWSGYDTYADAISRAVRFDAAKKWSDAFTFPVEFVTYESEHHYVTFKFRVPMGSTDKVRAVKPGEWITATSRHRASTESEAITAVNPYVISSASKTNTN
jgi:hypothetical protein